VNGSPYSFAEQLPPSVTRAPPEVQLSVLAWWTPKLWPSSWPTTRNVMAPLIQLEVPGRYARPDHPQTDDLGNA
jgi:hypothetical protein